MRGYLFEYELVQARQGETATVRYTDRIYKAGSDSFEYFKETKEAQFMSYPIEQINDTHKEWLKALGHTNAVIFEANEKLRKEASGTNVSSETDDPLTFDMTDIDKLFAAEGRGRHMLELDFMSETEEPIEYVDKNNRPNKYWWWKHKLTGSRVKLFATASGKQFDTGRLSKSLMRIRKRDNALAYARAQRILILNRSNLSEQVSSETVTPLERKVLLRQQVRQLKV